MTSTSTAAPHPMLKVAPEVAEALAAGTPVVALESTIISHGMPYPQNVAMAREVEQIVRDGGAVPATIAILNGRPDGRACPTTSSSCSGPTSDIRKVSVRDIAARRRHRRARGHDGREHDADRGAGRHPGLRHRWSRAACTGAPRPRWTSRPTSPSSRAPRSPSSSAGVKSILDIGRTLEVLETLGVPVVGYGTDEFPSFFSRSSGIAVPMRVDTPRGGRPH